MTEPTQPPPADPPPHATPSPPGYPYPQLPPGYPPHLIYRPSPPFNTDAILSIIFAVFVLPPLGIYFGKKAKQEIERTGERGIELATAGIITGWILSGLMGLFLIIWCGMFITVFGGFFGILGSVNVSQP